MIDRPLKRSTKIVFSAIYFVLVTLFRGGLRLVGRPSGGRLTILYYHGVSTKYRANFARQMATLNRRACVVDASHRGPLPSNKKCAAITFDDAFQSVLENAYPELSARSLHATIFVPVGLIGLSPTWAMEKDESDRHEVVMTVDQLQRLSGPGVSLGSHTISHPSMPELSRDRAQEEIRGSRHRLAEISGQEIRTLSFPYGDYNASVVEMCRSAGYEFVFSILDEEIDTERYEILRGRTKVDPSDGPIEFFLKFNGGYVWTARFATLVRKLRSMMGLKEVRKGL
jgi:peptidoglycan/xylan/chitin deacetylase (PgdA/CDA1 family)